MTWQHMFPCFSEERQVNVTGHRSPPPSSTVRTRSSGDRSRHPPSRWRHLARAPASERVDAVGQQDFRAPSGGTGGAHIARERRAARSTTAPAVTGVGLDPAAYPHEVKEFPWP